MFATAAYFEHVSLLGVLAVFAAILAVFLGRTITCRMGAFIFVILDHKTILLSCSRVIYRDPKTRICLSMMNLAVFMVLPAP